MALAGTRCGAPATTGREPRRCAYGSLRGTRCPLPQLREQRVKDARREHAVRALSQVTDFVEEDRLGVLVNRPAKLKNRPGATCAMTEFNVRRHRVVNGPKPPLKWIRVERPRERPFEGRHDLVSRVQGRLPEVQTRKWYRFASASNNSAVWP